MEEIDEIKEEVRTLETEIKKFTDTLPYWSKYLAEKILSGNALLQTDIDTAYSYLLEELELKEETEKPELSISYNPNASDDYKDSLVFESLTNVIGVNALKEDQNIELTPNLTIIYGTNGAGKSGYVRLLKNAFYSKHKETILENVNLDSGYKPISANFVFSSDNTSIPLEYPRDSANGIFNQFAVFDGEIGKKHLSNRNNFSFRPAGLRLFNEFNAALEQLSNCLNHDIQTKSIINPFAEDDIFHGESEIKTHLIALCHSSNLKELKKYLPYTAAEKVKKVELDKKYDDLKIALSQKEKSLANLRNIKVLLEQRKKSLENINTWFTQGQLDKVRNQIDDSKIKEQIAHKEGIDKFKSDKISNIGSPEWKQFIEAAEKYALTQSENEYPKIGDNCLLCHQEIAEEANKELITNYWSYIKSLAEKEARVAQDQLNKTKEGYATLNFNQFPTTDVLSVWLKEKYGTFLIECQQALEKQKVLAQDLIKNINGKELVSQKEIQLDLSSITKISNQIDLDIKAFEEDEQSKVLADLLKKKTYLAHKEKLEIRYSDIELLHKNMIWVNKANKFNKQSFKSQSTNTEKRLSQEYFNADYISAFNAECEKLNGQFGVEIDARSSDAQSNRQLFLKGKNPSTILSEGEQKVIALADFIAETNMTAINKGIIFDDPVNSLDEERKSVIAKRLVEISNEKQVFIFTHDLVFVSSLIGHTEELDVNYACHWIENVDGKQAGTIWLNNTPSFEKSYKKSGKAQAYYEEAKKLPPQEREFKIKNGFAALRTSYETQVVFGLFNGVVQRFNERVSVDSLNGVVFNSEIRDKILDSFYQCCRYMEGHSHSDKYSYKKPILENLNEEIQRFNEISKEIKGLKAS